MSTPTTNDRWTTAALEGPWGRILPWLALFTRCTVGLCLLNFGMMQLIFGSSSANPPSADLGSVIIWILLQAVPYLGVAIGLGLVFGIYTTLNALLTCALALILPLVVLVTLISQSVLGTGGPGFQRSPYGLFGPEAGVGLIFASYAVFVMPCLIALVLLSPMAINRYSLDTLMFGKPKPPMSPPTETTDARPPGNPFDLEKPDGETSS
jgi:hypothetical protein